MRLITEDLAQPAAADDKYVYFGTYELLCYDRMGNDLWQCRLDTPASKYGTATSPVLHEDKVILVLDGDGGSSRLLAVAENKIYLRTTGHLYVLGE